MTGPRNQDRRACQPSSPTRAVLARALQAVSAREKAEDPPGPLPRSSSLLGDPLPSSFHCTGLGKVTWAKAHSRVGGQALQGPPPEPAALGWFSAPAPASPPHITQEGLLLPPHTPSP